MQCVDPRCPPRRRSRASVVVMALCLLRRVLDGVDDVLIAGATAEVAINARSDLLLRGMRVLLQQVDGGHDHPGSTVATLEAVLFPETFLQGMKLALGS